jgi:protein tyrosine/serine phosphatase
MATLRRVAFEGLVNFRDLGGLPVSGGGRVRRGLLYRSDSVAYASDEDAARLVRELGISAVIDLRGYNEVEMLGRGPLERAAVRYLPVPIADVYADSELVDYYLAIMDQCGRVMVELLRELTEPGILPAVVHCEAGCDRTGVLCAVVLSLLGVPDREICADYALTAYAMPAINARVRATIERHGLDVPPGYVDDSWAPTAETMAATLAGATERWGGVYEWARWHGLRRAEADTLRRRLVEWA